MLMVEVSVCAIRAMIQGYVIDGEVSAGPYVV